MSGRAYGQGFSVIPDSVLYADISPNAVRLWAILQRHSDPEGKCYPGLKRLKDAMRCSTDTVARAKKELAEAGLIECKERYDEHGRRTTDDIDLGGALVRGAHRKSAGYVPRTDAVTEVNPEEVNPSPPRNRRAVGTNPRALGTNPRAGRSPTDTSPILPWAPEEPVTSEDRKQAAKHLREIRQQFDPADCQEFGCDDHEAEG